MIEISEFNHTLKHFEGKLSIVTDVQTKDAHGKLSSLTRVEPIKGRTPAATMEINEDIIRGVINHINSKLGDPNAQTRIQ